MVLFRIADQGIGLLSTLILVRVLIPDDFGVVALATSVIALLELMSSFGFDMALIQSRTSRRDEYDTAWTFNAIFGLTSAVLLIALIPVAVDFYDEPRIRMVMVYLAIGLAISGFENIGIVAFRKEMVFSKEFQFLFGKRLAGFCVTIPLVFLLESYWALVAGILAGHLYGLIASYVLHPYRPRFSIAAAGTLFNFSKWLLVSNILYFLRIRSADFIIGRIAGAAALGLYTIAFDIANMITTHLIAPVNRAVYPGYSQLSHDPRALADHFLLVIAFIAMIVVPAGLGMTAVADYVVPVALGDNWADALPLIKVLAIYGAVTALQTNVGYVYLAIGKPKFATLLTGAFVATSLPLLVYFTSKEGTVGAAKAYLMASLVALPLYYFDICRRMRIRFIDLFGAVWRIFAAAAAMYAIVTLFVSWLGLSESMSRMFAYLMASSAFGALVYLTLLYLLWSIDKSGRAEELLFQRIGQIVSRASRKYL